MRKWWNQENQILTIYHIKFTTILFIWLTTCKENGVVKNTGRVPEEITEEEASRQMSLCAKHAFSWLEIAPRKIIMI